MVQCVLADALYLEAFGNSVCQLVFWSLQASSLIQIWIFVGFFLRLYNHSEEFLLFPGTFFSSFCLDRGLKFGAGRKEVCDQI